MSSQAGGYLLVASDGAGSTQDEAVAAARAALGAELVTTSTPEDLDAALDRLDGRTLVVAGGDGSLHLAVSRLLARDALATTRLALVPLGTGNDLARALGIPLDPTEAAQLARDGTSRRLDLLADDAGGLVVNAVHVGVGVDAGEHADRLKPRFGAIAYPLGAVRAGLRSTGWRLRVLVDGRVVGDSHRRTLMVGIGNGSTIGGGTPLLPLAVPDDGLLDVLVSHACGPVARLRYGTALAAGQHLRDREVRYARGTTVTVVGEEVGVNADGDTGDRIRHRTWTVQPQAWSLVRP